MGLLIFFGALGMMLGDSEAEKEIKKNMRKVSSDANLFYNPNKISKLGRIYPYYTARYVARSGSSALGQDESYPANYKR